MVTTNSPYTRTTWTEDFAWNEIIQEVNNLATNPDEGCEPLGTLEEVEEDHIWTKTDIIEVQDKLIEICPDNVFTEHELWTTVIIDEIITALAVGWCECQEDVFGIWTDQSLDGNPSPNCGGYVSEPFMCLRNVACRYIFLSTCYDMSTTAYNVGKALANMAFDIAHENVNLWKADRREELLEQRKVEEYSTELIVKRAQLESLQNQLAACPSSCGSIITAISEIEAEISELEGKIQEAKNKRDEAKEKAEAHLILADDAATENWEILADLEIWDPTYVNFIIKLEEDGLVPKRLEEGEEEEEHEDEWWDWGMGSYPYTLPKRSNWILRGVYQTGWQAYTMFGYFTPSGLPYTRSSPGRTFSYIYMRRETEVRGWNPFTETWGPWESTGIMYYHRSRWYPESDNGIPEMGSYTFYHDPTRGSAPVEPYNPDPDQ